MRILKFIAYLCLLLPAICAPISIHAKNSDISAQEDAIVRNVLLLNSYNKGYRWTDNEVAAIEQVLGDVANLNLRVEYMDTKWVNTPAHLDMLRQLFAEKYANTKFSLLIATDDDALKFLRQYRAQLFADTPTVFAGINNLASPDIEGFDRVTGVNERADFSGNLDLIARLQPQVTDLYVIVDELTAGQLIRKEFQLAADDPAVSGRFNYHYLTGMTMQQVRTKVASLQDKAAVFYLSFFKDAAGRHYAPNEAIPLISRSASVPMYGQVDYMIGQGIMGGLVKSSTYQGKLAGQLAHRVLDGEPIESIPVVMDSPNNHMFDYEQLQRFGISMAKLPVNSVIVNEPQTFYYRYKMLIWSVVSIMFGLLVFIAILLFNIRKRKRAQRGLNDIIQSMSQVFNPDSVSKLREMMLSIINQVIFLGRNADDVAYYRYAGAPGSFDSDLLTAVDAAANDYDRHLPLLRESLQQSTSVVQRNRCVALLDHANIQANLIYLQGQRRFDDIDRDLLDILVNNISMALDALEKNKLQETLETARKIQQSMLPHDFTPVSKPFGLDLHAKLIAAKEVGGDLYDCFPIDEDRLCVTVGDVSGKGVPAALFMVMAKTLIRSVGQEYASPQEILYRVNNILSQDNDQCLFVTLFLGVFDRRTGEFVYASAGHNPPCLCRGSGEIEWLPSKNELPLGPFEGVDYTNMTTQIDPGDSLFIYSDGITEAMNPESELFGEQRLQQTLAILAGQGAAELNTNVLAALDQFTRDAVQSDDITLLYLQRLRA